MQNPNIVYSAVMLQENLSTEIVLICSNFKLSLNAAQFELREESCVTNLCQIEKNQGEHQS